MHGNERGGLEGGLRTVEDLALAADQRRQDRRRRRQLRLLTGSKPEFHEYEVRDVLAKKVVYLTDFNPDGWAVGDFFNRPAPTIYNRGNGLNTDLNRQMPTVGRIDAGPQPPRRSPRCSYGDKLMREVAAQGTDGRMDYGADMHGELTSRAYIDIMYPAGQFDSVEHRRLMAIAERTKSVIDATLYAGIVDEIEERRRRQRRRTGSSHLAEQHPDQARPLGDRLGHARLHRHGLHRRLPRHRDSASPGWTTRSSSTTRSRTRRGTCTCRRTTSTPRRGIIKTAMAYALFQEEEFNERNVVHRPGRPARLRGRTPTR